MTSSN